jgi:hypothetical protein
MYLIASPTAGELVGPCGSNDVCLVFTAIEPRIVPNRVGTTLYLLGSGLTENADSIVLTVNGNVVIDKTDYSVVQDAAGQQFVEWVMNGDIAIESEGVVEVQISKPDQDPAEAANLQILRLFSPEASQITSFTPTKIDYPFSQVSVEIMGPLVFAEYQSVCVFYVGDQVISSETAITQGGAYFCALSSLLYKERSGRINLSILYDTPQVPTV